jgi:hypothetical protein
LFVCLFAAAVATVDVAVVALALARWLVLFPLLVHFDCLCVCLFVCCLFVCLLFVCLFVCFLWMELFSPPLASLPGDELPCVFVCLFVRSFLRLFFRSFVRLLARIIMFYEELFDEGASLEGGFCRFVSRALQ